MKLSAKITVNPFTRLRIKKDAARHAEFRVFDRRDKFYILFTHLALPDVTFVLLQQTYNHETDFLAIPADFINELGPNKQKGANQSTN